MERYLEKFILKDLKEKIVLLSGPRQVGKTTLSRQLTASHVCLNYDASPDRRIIHAREWDRDAEMVIFDELDKMRKWKSWVKGIYDTEGISPSLLVTGSARLDTYRKGGESLAGRFFYYRLHPLTVKKICACLGEKSETALDKIIKLGGFPEPYLKDSETFAKRSLRIHDENFSSSLFRFRDKLRNTKPFQIVYRLKRNKSRDGVRMLPAHRFLRDFELL